VSPTRPPGRTRLGQALVEFALVLPVFLLLAMGTVDLGRGVIYHNLLSNVAREGARVGILHSSTYTTICNQVIAEALLPNLGPTPVTCTATGSPDAVTTDGSLTITVHKGTPGSASDPDQVTLSYRFTPITPLIANIVRNPLCGTSLCLSASSSMYVEN
jgi:Flp pilus assembly protein TadG